jgi:S-adenosylmethionine-diacylgycerolhomoserine-N-methlytransferase
VLIRQTWRDLRTLSQLARPARRRGPHADRLEDFYRGQARDYDAFRQRLLPGRQELIGSLPLAPSAVWIDLGGGTAHNLLHAGPALAALHHVYVVDLTPSLLAIARQRCRDQAWSNVTLIEGDATDVRLPAGCADVVTCSYSLTMIPEWRAAVSEAWRLLTPGGTFGAVDFYVGPRHSQVTRSIWPWWFAHSHVHLSPDHVPFLQRRFATSSLHEDRTRLPYVPVGRVPYYRFTGVKPAVTP